LRHEHARVVELKGAWCEWAEHIVKQSGIEGVHENRGRRKKQRGEEYEARETVL
jgi:hypothetical protein